MTDDSHTQSSEGTAPVEVEVHPVGTLVVDTNRMRLGRLMGHEGPYVQLRPPGGGREWDAKPENVRRAHDDELLRVSVAEMSLTTPGRTP
ncbi:hypothetical protein ACFWY6_10795 [Streptomyces sp. NPDC059037]|uniref:hypothetical protein n=1 Tax=Streptomyces sp. NPDC059037 TaxID=3346710 RepID=UPI0036A3EE23